VVNETNGVWGNAEEIPKTASLNAGGVAALNSVSCASAGNCSAGGFYTDSSVNLQAFVVDETNGVWGNAEEVPNTATLNASGSAELESVSCASAGNCSAGGFYSDSSGSERAFVASRVNGTWGNAKQVPNTAKLGGSAELDTVSCASAGNCGAGGYYIGSGTQQAFVVSQVNGVWGNAEEVPNTATLNAGGAAQLTSVSCASAGNCSAGGWYSDRSGDGQAFVVSQASGTWRNAEEVPGVGSLNSLGAVVESLSCSSAGNCSAGGFYAVSTGHTQVFVVNQASGTWGNAEEVPGIGSLNVGMSADLYTLSCSSAGNCTTGGYYTGNSGHMQAFLADKSTGS
jgi:hypothetical protein